MLAVLTFVLRGDPNAIGLDASAANWGDRDAAGFTTDVLEAITFVGEPTSIAVLAAILAAVETVRTRSRWVVPFLLLVVAGQRDPHHVDQAPRRPRPAGAQPDRRDARPVVPERALVVVGGLLRRRGAPARARPRAPRAHPADRRRRWARRSAIATTRVLLDVHWLSDVVAGLALGWAWFAVCAIAFGGRLLRFGAPAEEAAARPAGITQTEKEVETWRRTTARP